MTNFMANFLSRLFVHYKEVFVSLGGQTLQEKEIMCPITDSLRIRGLATTYV